MSPRAAEPKSTVEGGTNEDGDRIHEFLLRELPSDLTNQSHYFTRALRQAGARYDRYTASRHEWWNYKARMGRLIGVTKLAEDLEQAYATSTFSAAMTFQVGSTQM